LAKNKSSRRNSRCVQQYVDQLKKSRIMLNKLLMKHTKTSSNSFWYCNFRLFTCTEENNFYFFVKRKMV